MLWTLPTFCSPRSPSKDGGRSKPRPTLGTRHLPQAACRSDLPCLDSSVPSSNRSAFAALVDGTLDSDRGTTCHENCFFPPIVGKGDLVGLPITGVDVGAVKIRALSKQKRKKGGAS